MRRARFAWIFACLLLARIGYAAAGEGLSAALAASIRDDPSQAAQAKDGAEAARLLREQAARDTRRMRRLPPHAVAALARGEIAFEDLAFADDDTLTAESATAIAKQARENVLPRPTHAPMRFAALGLAVVLLAASFLMKVRTRSATPGTEPIQ